MTLLLMHPALLHLLAAEAPPAALGLPCAILAACALAALGRAAWRRLAAVQVRP